MSYKNSTTANPFKDSLSWFSKLNFESRYTLGKKTIQAGKFKQGDNILRGLLVAGYYLWKGDEGRKGLGDKYNLERANELKKLIDNSYYLSDVGKKSWYKQIDSLTNYRKNKSNYKSTQRKLHWMLTANPDDESMIKQQGSNTQRRKEAIAKVDKAYKELSSELGHPPSQTMLAKRSKVRVETVKIYLHEHVSDKAKFQELARRKALIGVTNSSPKTPETKPDKGSYPVIGTQSPIYYLISDLRSKISRSNTEINKIYVGASADQGVRTQPCESFDWIHPTKVNADQSCLDIYPRVNNGQTDSSVRTS